MTKITLTILGSDIKETDYSNSYDCAITRALKRAGYPNYSDAGTEIQDDENDTIIVTNKNDTYCVLVNKVLEMYKKFDNSDGDEEIEDYTHVLEF